MYSKLQEPDGLGGLLRLRHGGPCLQDQILAAEMAGNFPEALTLYEQACPSLTFWINLHFGQHSVSCHCITSGQGLRQWPRERGRISYGTECRWGAYKQISACV